MINFGKYTERVSFITNGQSPDGYGGFIPNQVVELTTSARMIQSKASNSIESLQLKLPNTYVMGIQWRSGFQPDQTHQVLYRDILHEINGVFLNDERNRKEWIVTLIKTNQEVVVTPPTVSVSNTLQPTLQFTI
jgi:hypothetical protein